MRRNDGLRRRLQSVTGPALKEVNRVGKQFEDGFQRFDGAFGAARESDEDQRPGPHRSTTLPGRIAGRERPTGRGWDGRAHRKGDFVSTHPRCPMGTRGSASAPAGLAAEEGPEKVGVSVQLPRFVCALHLPARLYGGNDLDGPAAVPKCFPESPVSMAARAERGRGRAEAGRRVRSLFDRLFSHHSAPPRSPRWRRKPAAPPAPGRVPSAARLRSGIKRLRRKLGDHAAGRAYIFNEHGVDYRVPEQEER